MPTQDEIFEKVQATLVDALGVDDDGNDADATLQERPGCRVDRP